MFTRSQSYTTGAGTHAHSAQADAQWPRQYACAYKSLTNAFSL